MTSLTIQWLASRLRLEARRRMRVKCLPLHQQAKAPVVASANLCPPNHPPQPLPDRRLPSNRDPSLQNLSASRSHRYLVLHLQPGARMSSDFPKSQSLSPSSPNLNWPRSRGQSSLLGAGPCLSIHHLIYLRIVYHAQICSYRAPTYNDSHAALQYSPRSASRKGLLSLWSRRTLVSHHNQLPAMQGLESHLLIPCPRHTSYNPDRRVVGDSRRNRRQWHQNP